jgi:integrase
MVLMAGCLRLRVSEILALKWTDLDYSALTVRIERVYTHSRMQDSPKSDSSESDLPLYPALAQALQDWQTRQLKEHDYPFVLASPRTGRPYSADTIRYDYLAPAALKLGFDGFGWHTIRHSRKAWRHQRS